MDLPLSPFALQKDFFPANKLQQATGHDTPALLFIFSNNQLLVSATTAGYTVPFDILTRFPTSQSDYIRYLGLYDNSPCYLIVAAVQFAAPQNHQWMNLRPLHGLLSHDYYLLAGKAAEISTWYQTNIYCGRCGTPMEDHKRECARICPACHFIAFPRSSPVVIMTVEQEDNILLGRSYHYPKGMYSPLAGFVDAGETAEEAVVREVKEEAGIVIKNLRYITSQVWPYPHSLMLGFRTEYDHGEIVIEQEELEDVRWFNVHELPDLPSSISISRYLMECFINEKIKP